MIETVLPKSQDWLSDIIDLIVTAVLSRVH